MLCWLLLNRKVNHLYVSIYRTLCIFLHLVTREHGTEFPELYSRFSLVICFVHSSVYICPFQSPTSAQPSFPYLVSRHLSSMSMSLSVLQIKSSIPFSRFYIYMLIYNINGHLHRGNSRKYNLNPWYNCYLVIPPIISFLIQNFSPPRWGNYMWTVLSRWDGVSVCSWVYFTFYLCIIFEGRSISLGHVQDNYSSKLKINSQ